MRHVMLDIETMGTAPGSAIIQIGAVEFSVYKVGDPFSVNVSLESSVAAGLRMDPKTVMWWMSQSDAARGALTENTITLRDALTQFAEWFGTEKTAVWGDGAAFDNVLLASAYRVMKMPTPWHFSCDRCFRTLKELFPVERILAAVPHNAASDAIAQANHVRAIVAKYAIRLDRSASGATL